MTLEELEQKVMPSRVEVLRPDRLPGPFERAHETEEIDFIDVYFTEDGKSWVIRVLKADVDAIGWDQLGNVWVVDSAKRTFRDYILQVKLTLERGRGHLVPTIHHMTEAVYKDILEFGGGE